MIKSMLRRENELRLCDETQQKFKAINTKNPGSGWLQVVEQLQYQVCDEFGLPYDVGLTALRSPQLLLPNDDPDLLAEIIDISLYRKYNRCRDGNLNVNDSPPTNVKILHFESKQEILFNDLLLKESPTPVVIFAGSYT